MNIVLANLSDLICLPDPEAAEAMNARIAVLDQIHRIYERSYSERGIIVREFERRKLWQHLADPLTGQTFPNFSAWMACDNFLGCRRTNFEAKADIKELENDVPAHKLIDVPKDNLKVLKGLSTSVRQQDDVLAAARTMRNDQFLQKVEKEHPNQHIESRRPLRFSPDRSGAKVVEEAIAWALDHDIAGSRDEALVRMAEQALHEWQLELELKDMPAEEVEP